VAARRGQQGRQPGLVATLEGLLHLEDHVVAAGLLRAGGLRQHDRPQQQGCQNASKLHRGIMDKAHDGNRSRTGAKPSAAGEFLKAQVRKALIEQRLAMPDRMERAALLQQVLRIWLVGRPDTVIGAYWPIKGEFDPLPALHRWKEDGELLDEPQLRRIGLPVVNKQHKTLTFHAWYPGCEMEDDAYGIPKPKDTELIVPTLLFVPCVGYAPGGYRLG